MKPYFTWKEVTDLGYVLNSMLRHKGTIDLGGWMLWTKVREMFQNYNTLEDVAWCLAGDKIKHRYQIAITKGSGYRAEVVAIRVIQGHTLPVDPSRIWRRLGSTTIKGSHTGTMSYNRPCET